jgi:hypothetical protein
LVITHSSCCLARFHAAAQKLYCGAFYRSAALAVMRIV